MKGFSGFPDGKLRATSLPNLFFSDLMPLIDNLAEMKVTLYAFWALSQRDTPVRFLHLVDFMGDIAFLKGLDDHPTKAAELVVDGIERAVARGTLLHVSVDGAEGRRDLYFANTQRGRAAVGGISRGEWRPSTVADEPLSLLVERPNVFVLYEQNIGPLTPIIAEELRDAEQMYPNGWLEEAIKQAVRNNVRKWRYVMAILERWRQEGKESGTTRRDHKTSGGRRVPDEYQDIIKR